MKKIAGMALVAITSLAPAAFAADANYPNKSIRIIVPFPPGGIADVMSGAPELPTIAESGLPGFDVTQWIGVFAPAATPQPIVDRIYAAVVASVKQPDLIERYETLGAEPLGNTPKEFALLVASDVKRWAEIVRAAKLKID